MQLQFLLTLYTNYSNGGLSLYTNYSNGGGA